MRCLTLSADHLRPQLRDDGDDDATALESLSEELRGTVERWNDDYQVVVPLDPPARRPATDLVAALDSRGLDLARRIAAELHPAKVAHVSEGAREETARVTTVEAHAEAAYADLAARAHDQGWERRVGDSTWWLLLHDLFVEVELDQREGSAHVLVGPLRGGARPRGYYLDEGTRVRWHLGDALELAGLPHRTAPADLGGALGEERVRRALAAHREDVSTALAHLDVLATALQEAR